MRVLWRILYTAVFLACAGALGAVGYLQQSLPDSYTVTAGESFRLGALVDSAPTDGGRTVAQIGTRETYRANLRLLGAVPIKPITVTVADSPTVMVCGTPFGIKLYTEGVLVVGLTDVDTAAGSVNPAAAAGICIGDILLSVNGQAVESNEDVAALINACGGRSVTVRVRRDGVEFTAAFTPVCPVDGTGYRAGMWVRDSTAGVGMLTFYDPATGAFAGLGHAVCDADTGEQLTLSAGEIVPARIHGIKRSLSGNPGELQGGFEAGSLGELRLNAANGLYGTLSLLPLPGESMPVAMKQEIETGPAQVYTTIDGSGPRLYDVEVEQVRYNASAVTRHMVIRITDETLLSATGGIVQGMSGSPIIQNGKLVGAVTHVLVDDPTKGYAIFAENMLETAQIVAENNKLKDAS